MPLSCVLRLACLIALLLSTAYRLFLSFFFFFFNSAATTEIYTLSLHDALPISSYPRDLHHLAYTSVFGGYSFERFGRDRKSTRLNSSHVAISYAVFCLKKKKRIFTDLNIYCYKA